MVSSQRRDLRSTLELPSPNYVYACEWGRGLVRLVFSGCFTYVNFSLYLRFDYCWSEEKRKKKLRKPLDRCWSPTLVYVSLSWIMTFIVSPGDICVLTTLWSRSQKNTLKNFFWFQKLTFKRRSRGRSLQTRAHLPLNRIHPANTRGQRWQAWRMRAALSRRRGSTWGNESDEMLPAAHAEINNKKNDFAFILSSTEQISSVCPLYCLHVSCRHTK